MLVGIQWSGKGTQARKILETFPEYVLFETGEELRREAKRGTQMGNEIKAIIEAWQLVKTEYVRAVLEVFLTSHPDTPILFDSVIRSKEQNEILSSIIPEFDVIFLELSEEKAIDRLSKRRIDPETNEGFGADFTGDTNPKTGNKLITRFDDTPENIRNRINWSIRDTLPLIGIWRSEGHTIHTIDASESVDTVFQQIKSAINQGKKIV